MLSLITTLTFTPKYFLAFFTKARAIVSVPPPAAQGTIKVMSLAGNFWAIPLCGNITKEIKAKIKTKVIFLLN